MLVDVGREFILTPLTLGNKISQFQKNFKKEKEKEKEKEGRVKKKKTTATTATTKTSKRVEIEEGNQSTRFYCRGKNDLKSN